MIEQTASEIAEAMKERPEDWAQLYLEMKLDHALLAQVVEKILNRGQLGVKH